MAPVFVMRHLGQVVWMSRLRFDVAGGSCAMRRKLKLFKFFAEIACQVFFKSV